MINLTLDQNKVEEPLVPEVWLDELVPAAVAAPDVPEEPLVPEV